MTVTSTVLPSPTGSQPSRTPSTPLNKSKSHALAIGATLGVLAILVLVCSVAFCLLRKRRARMNLEKAHPWVPLASEAVETQPLILLSSGGHTQNLSTSTFHTFRSEKASLGQTPSASGHLRVPSSDSADTAFLRSQIAQLEQEVIALRASRSPPFSVTRHPRLRPPLPPQTPPLQEALVAT